MHGVYSGMRWWNGFSLLFVGVLGVLTLMAFSWKQPSTGIMLRVMEPDPNPRHAICDSSRTIVLQVSNAGYKINQDEVPREQLSRMMAEIMKTRAEKIMFFRADPDVNYDDVIQALARVQAAVPDLKIVAVPPDDLLNSYAPWRIRPTFEERVEMGEFETGGIKAPWRGDGPLRIR